jgi:hypothetical protein
MNPPTMSERLIGRPASDNAPGRRTAVRNSRNFSWHMRGGSRNRDRRGYTLPRRRGTPSYACVSLHCSRIAQRERGGGCGTDIPECLCITRGHPQECRCHLGAGLDLRLRHDQFRRRPLLGRSSNSFLNRRIQPYVEPEITQAFCNIIRYKRPVGWSTRKS